MVRLVIAAAVVCMTFMSGCAGTAASLQAEAGESPPDRLLVRIFMDDLDHDGADELHIRLAAVSGTEVYPFEGAVEVIVVPEEDQGPMPLLFYRQVAENEFVDAVLPYYEIVADAGRYRPGQTVEVIAEARLPDGGLLEGNYLTTM